MQYSQNGSGPANKANIMLSPSEANIQRFKVDPAIPESLKKLQDIARNLWWCWHYEAVALFSQLDRDLWEQTHHNPVKLLGMISQERLDRAAADRSFLYELSTVHAQMLEDVQRQRSWFSEQSATLLTSAAGRQKPMRIAYFCAEFGLTEGFQIYSGGLGGLSGDHLKSASDMGIPLVAVGLLYQQGYFHQYLNPDGWQQETNPDLDPYNQPCEIVRSRDGTPLMIFVDLPGRKVAVRVWRAKVGQVPLYLLDTNVEHNSREDRTITQRLYGGDHEHRIKQEIVLGFGGVMALRAVGEEPSVCHINEGHAAFISLERIMETRRRNPGISFDEAREAVAASQIFTTHTPVPAGIDRFEPALVERYLQFTCADLGLDAEGVLALGRENTADRREAFSMAVLAIRTTRFCNGVSKLHGVVSRGMWKHMWPGTPASDVPIGHVTNGVHCRTWMSPEMIRLYDRHLGDRWQTNPQDEQVWSAVNEIPDHEIWSAHEKRKEKLVGYVRSKLREQLTARGAGATEIERATSALDTNALTIGFARRFATYKRGTLLFRDAARLLTLVGNTERPVQIIVAGKSHPADGGGKQLIRDIVQFIRQNNILHRIVFLEDYDMQICRRMVQGCDIWLNTPIRGLEASGTSGMKAAMNGTINCSILDGWWDEAFGPELGFSIGRGENYESASGEERDEIESRALYQCLESQIVPEFFDRDSSGIPKRWVARMKRCIRLLAPGFTTHRMLADYARQYYFPAHAAAARLTANTFKEAKELAAHMAHYRANWQDVRVESVSAATPSGGSIAVRSSVTVTATVKLGLFAPSEVLVQLYHGPVNALGEVYDAQAVTMKHDGKGQGEPGVFKFTGTLSAAQTGQHGYSVRVLPSDDRMVSPFVSGLITWDTGAAEPELAAVV